MIIDAYTFLDDYEERIVNYTIYDETALLIPFPNYTLFPACDVMLRYKVMLDGLEVDYAWLGPDYNLLNLNV